MTASPEASPNDRYRTRLWVLFAREAPRAVLLRRGPRTHFHLIAWDLRDHSFRPGQWMKGFVRLHDLSPRGERLIYWAHQYHPSAAARRAAAETSGPYDPAAPPRPARRSPRKGEHRRRTPRYLRGGGAAAAPPVRRNEGVWTALSRPPFFSALAIWPSFGHWTGGGVFRSEQEIVINEPPDRMTPQLNAGPPPEGVRIRSRQEVFGRGAVVEQRVAAAWRPSMVERDLRHRLMAGLFRAGAGHVDWVAPRERGPLLFAADGQIFRCPDWRRLAPDDLLGASERLADFRGQTFTRVAPDARAVQW